MQALAIAGVVPNLISCANVHFTLPSDFCVATSFARNWSIFSTNVWFL
jgi:hypothetical protein